MNRCSGMEKALLISWIRSERNGFMFLMKLPYQNVLLQDLVTCNRSLVLSSVHKWHSRFQEDIGTDSVHFETPSHDSAIE